MKSLNGGVLVDRGTIVLLCCLRPPDTHNTRNQSGCYGFLLLLNSSRSLIRWLPWTQNSDVVCCGRQSVLSVRKTNFFIIMCTSQSAVCFSLSDHVTELRIAKAKIAELESICNSQKSEVSVSALGCRESLVLPESFPRKPIMQCQYCQNHSSATIICQETCHSTHL